MRLLGIKQQPSGEQAVYLTAESLSKPGKGEDLTNCIGQHHLIFLNLGFLETVPPGKRRDLFNQDGLDMFQYKNVCTEGLSL